MRLLQVCNVGNIVGGTAACAWSTTRALPDFEHSIWFRSPPTRETQSWFSHCQIQSGAVLNQSAYEAMRPDFVLLHNTPAAGVDSKNIWPENDSVWIYYQHSAGKSAPPTDLQVVCSESLRETIQQPNRQVLYQGVPLASPLSSSPKRELSEQLIVGRICTPVKKKWPDELIDFYQRMEQRFPLIQWEFVGCPEQLQSSLSQSLSGKVKFYPAGWTMRELFQRWHILLSSQPGVPETFGRTCAEAMRCGCVPIVDAAGGFCEQVKANTGYLCAAPEEFETALSQLSDQGHWWECSWRAREWANQKFSHAAFRQRLLETFQHACRVKITR